MQIEFQLDLRFPRQLPPIVTYTPVYFISNQAQIRDNLSNFKATVEAENAWKLCDLRLKPFYKSQEEHKRTPLVKNHKNQVINQ